MLPTFSSYECNRHIISILLQNLAIKDSESYQVVRTLFFKTYEKFVEDILNILISNAVTKFVPPMSEWIFAVPLIHFMKKCVPFDHVQGLTWELVNNLTR